MINEVGNENKKMDPVIFRARRKMEALGKAPLFAEAIISAVSVEDIDNQAIRLGIPANHAQILAIPFKSIYEADPALKTAAHDTLAPLIKDWGLPENFIDWYLTVSDYPGLSFAMRYREIDFEKRDSFDQATYEFMFGVVKRYLEAE